MKYSLKIVLMILSLLLLISCNKNEHKKIKIGDTLIENQTYKENIKLWNAVDKTLLLEKDGLIELININCGGAAGCYDLGDIIVQIIIKTGEKNFLKMTNSLNSNQKNELNNFVEVGLEYGIKKDTSTINWKKINLELTK